MNKEQLSKLVGQLITLWPRANRFERISGEAMKEDGRVWFVQRSDPKAGLFITTTGGYGFMLPYDHIVEFISSIEPRVAGTLKLKTQVCIRGDDIWTEPLAMMNPRTS
jgi:hypothetical protein